MGQYSSIGSAQLSLRGNNLPPLRNHARFGAHPAGIRRDAPRKIRLGLDRRGTDARGQQRLRRTSGHAVDERQRPPAVDHAHRIQQVRTSVAFKRSETFADFREPE